MPRNFGAYGAHTLAEDIECSLPQELQKPKQTRQKFTQEEDQIIINLVGDEKYPNWNSIASNITGKSGRQCRERYQHYLSPSLKKEPWTPEEDELITKHVLQHGTNWALIAEQFGGKRTNNNIKNRWNNHLRLKFVKPDTSTPSNNNNNENIISNININPNSPQYPMKSISPSSSPLSQQLLNLNNSNIISKQLSVPQQLQQQLTTSININNSNNYISPQPQNFNFSNNTIFSIQQNTNQMPINPIQQTHTINSPELQMQVNLIQSMQNQIKHDLQVNQIRFQENAPKMLEFKTLAKRTAPQTILLSHINKNQKFNCNNNYNKPMINLQNAACTLTTNRPLADIQNSSFLNSPVNFDEADLPFTDFGVTDSCDFFNWYSEDDFPDCSSFNFSI